MTIATIRRYEAEDQARVKAAAERFCKRHGIKIDLEDGECAAEHAIEYWIKESYPEDKAYRRKLWTACYCRALCVPYDVRTTTYSGYIGVSVD
ncbi:hypothetical protein N5E86_21750 [Stutzerimonas stutzeri]|jgi:nitrite reductase/ring-hydroxylating ferredoxin subunit|uniref:hypothetical protein n=1 Tax=Stutzerimonas stutzeri TaxID=316 RepID=UPI002449EAC5|nr:hypothetical protein [Stutzerimonas stutzeri]MDH1557079.1 hypothetical protein [Stutzerimonas stutzeri]